MDRDVVGVGGWVVIGGGVDLREDVEGLYYDKIGDDGVGGSNSGNDIIGYFYSGYEY